MCDVVVLRRFFGGGVRDRDVCLVLRGKWGGCGYKGS